MCVNTHPQYLPAFHPLLILPQYRCFTVHVNEGRRHGPLGLPCRGPVQELHRVVERLEEHGGDRDRRPHRISSEGLTGKVSNAATARDGQPAVALFAMPAAAAAALFSPTAARRLPDWSPSADSIDAG